MANGIAEREFGLEIRAVEDIVNLMQVASRKNSVLTNTVRHSLTQQQ